jgi:hypothetical protein
MARFNAAANGFVSFATHWAQGELPLHAVAALGKQLAGDVLDGTFSYAQTLSCGGAVALLVSLPKADTLVNARARMEAYLEKLTVPSTATAAQLLERLAPITVPAAAWIQQHATQDEYALGPLGGALTPTRPLSLRSKAFHEVLDFVLGPVRDVPLVAKAMEDLAAKGFLASATLQQRVAKAEAYVAERTGALVTPDQHRHNQEVARGRQQCQECGVYFAKGPVVTDKERRFAQRIGETKEVFCSDACKDSVLRTPRCLKCNSRVKPYPDLWRRIENWEPLVPDCCGVIPELPPSNRRWPTRSDVL